MMMRLASLSLGFLLLSAFAAARADQPPSDAERLFVRQVKPILVSKCFACHGEKPDEVMGELNLLTREGSLRGGESGEAALVPGKPHESLIVKAVRWSGLEMPPKENDRLTNEQIGALEAWIAAGAPWPDESRQKWIADQASRDANADGVMVETSGGLSDDWTRRLYDPADIWAFQPIERYEVPWEALGEHDFRHPIDAFVRQKLTQLELTPAPPADRRTLIRRLSFDLTGLPPKGEDVAAFENDECDNAVTMAIERLLASRHYGERMAQHWLDVVRYADTSGYSNDWERPHAWRYRDYVIRSFHNDKPFDRFVREQIAGDELDPSDPELAVAVGFLRMGPWEHTGMSVAAETRQLWLDDVTNSVGETFLGHSLRCAQCHDHKFDPIPTRDYYRIQAVFAATQFCEPAAPLLAEENVADAEQRKALVARQLSDAALEPVTNIEGDNAFSRIQRKLAAYRWQALQRYEPVAFSVSNAEPELVTILRGGSLERRAGPVDPGVLSAVPGSDRYVVPGVRRGRRLELAEWLAAPDNPLTARVIVNRVWQWHFGTGLVATPNNFGKTGAKPTHPELLDWLTAWFIDHEWSIKALHRLILTSQTYQQSGQHPQWEKLARLDPNNALLACFPPRRLTAEEIRDAMLSVTGELSSTAGGPGTFPEIHWEVALQPRHIMGGVAPSYRPSPKPEDRHRRTIYAFRYRGLANPLLDVFNQPLSDLSCERRDETTVTTQALELLNGQFARDRAIALAHRIAQQTDDPRERAEQAFRHAYGRLPTGDERTAATAHLERMLEHHRGQKPAREQLPTVIQREMIAEQTGVPFRWREQLFLDDYQPDLKPADVSAETRALAELCLVLLNSSEFLYVY